MSESKLGAAATAMAIMARGFTPLKNQYGPLVSRVCIARRDNLPARISQKSHKITPSTGETNNEPTPMIHEAAATTCCHIN